MKSVDIGRAAAFFLTIAAAGGSSQAAPRGSAIGAPAVQLAQQDPGDDQGDAAASVVRLGRLEEQIRTLTGQIEQLQFQNRKLEDNLRKLQADTDFRFQDLQRGGGAGSPAPSPPALRPVNPPPPKRTGSGFDETPQNEATAPATAATTPAANDGPRPTGDAFDPDANPNAPGAPRPLGSTGPSQPLPPRVRTVTADPTLAPLDLARPRKPVPAPPAPDINPDAPEVIPAPPGAPRDTGSVASLVPGGTRDEYDADLGLYKQGQFDAAATGFAAFADKYPKDRLVPDAVYLAGESFARLGRHREAAEQFLRVSTDFGKSPRAPDSLLRLGMSLNALGAKEQACATYLEVTRRYPNASPDVRASVDRELKRARCAGNG